MSWLVKTRDQEEKENNYVITVYVVVLGMLGSEIESMYVSEGRDKKLMF
jgi:uncharacterized membrane-anchored protein